MRWIVLTLFLSVASAADIPLLPVPESFRSAPKGNLAPQDGYCWYRAIVKIPANWKGQEVLACVEALDDARSTWVNGTQVGATGSFPPRFRSGLGEPGRYTIPKGVLKPGDLNVIALRIYQSDARPNYNVAPPTFVCKTRQQGMRLQGKWQYQPGDDPNWASATLKDFGLTPADLSTDTKKLAEVGAFTSVDRVEDVDVYVRRSNNDQPARTPLQAEDSFEVVDDLEFKLVLSEPQIAQPLHISWDARGRLWLVEYRQYPDIAGIKMVSRDQYLRSVYDSVPKPPPFGAKGRDRISIHEDVNGDGNFDTHKVFVDGLNLASSAVVGRGGVFVTNPPYLLFYADKNGDDIPDGDPEVLLEGFGLEDSHSVINSLRFGPDGWLYGAQGSTVSAAVRRPGSAEEPIRTMGQQIWRYHPETREFEVFAEGGGNTFGVEIDSKGRVYSGHNGGDTRGFHYVQGGYYRKGFGKHGPLSNPFSFGYFNAMKHAKVPRFTHTFVIYEDVAFPKSYRGKLFGVEPLQGQIVMSDFRANQSSFETEDIERVVKTSDQWFRPVDIKVGPEGAIYVADMYEQRISHSSHYAGRIDRESGRVYRLQPKTRKSVRRKRRRDLSGLPGESLVALLTGPSRTQRETALRVLADRRDEKLIPLLEQSIDTYGDQAALDSLWALNGSGGFTEETASVLLEHGDEFVRAWTVRLLGDRRLVQPETAILLAGLAVTEPSIVVRKQLASSAKRLPAAQAIPILTALLQHGKDANDIHQPLLIWWALEAFAGPEDRSELLTLARSSGVWEQPLMTQHILSRLMKRFVVTGRRSDLEFAAQLLESAPDESSQALLINAFEDGYRGRPFSLVPDRLMTAIADAGGGSELLKLRQGDPEAMTRALVLMEDGKKKAELRIEVLDIIRETTPAEFLPSLLTMLKTESQPSVLAATIAAMQKYQDDRIAPILVKRWNDFDDETRLVAERVLTSQSDRVSVLLQALESKTLTLDLVTDAAFRRMLLHDDEAIARRVTSLKGSLAGATTSEMKAEISRVTGVLNAGSGNPKTGKALYAKTCGRCHRLFDSGGDVGPDLTPFQRSDVAGMLTSVVNPSLEIRKGYEAWVVATDDGQVHTGFLADQDPQLIVLRGLDGRNVSILRDSIEDQAISKTSVMPTNILKQLTDREIQDLFAYLRSGQPVNY